MRRPLLPVLTILVMVPLSLVLLLEWPLAPLSDAAEPRQRLDIRLLTRVPRPGQPEPIAIGPDGLVYVATNQLGHGDVGAPSKVFVYTPRGRLVRDYAVRGQPLGEEHGIQGLAFDGSGLLYLLDRSATPRVVVLDPISGDQRTYATFRDVPPCGPGGPDGNCSATVGDFGAAPDYATFAPDGTMFVTDIEQALIWRVPRGGGRARVWLTEPGFESIYGPNGIQVMADRRTLMFAVTGTPAEMGRGSLYKLPIRADGTPGELSLFWLSNPLDGPDGFALARSGNVYLALAGTSQIALISRRGEEVARAPADPIENESLEVPVDSPGSAAFLGRRVLVSNHSALRGEPRSWAILDVWAGERGLPLHYPVIGPRRLRPRIDLAVVPRRVRSGKRQRFRFAARVGSGPRSYPAAGTTIRFAGRRLRTGRAGHATLRVRPDQPGRLVAIAQRRGLRPARLRIIVAP